MKNLKELSKRNKELKKWIKFYSFNNLKSHHLVTLVLYSNRNYFQFPIREDMTLDNAIIQGLEWVNQDIEKNYYDIDIIS